LGRISKQGDAPLRGYLYEAATVLISRLQRPCVRRDWGAHAGRADRHEEGAGP
jgi:hypothetical protein